jgi:hypothetical protein
MRRLTLLFLFSVCFSPALRAQNPKDKIGCYSYVEKNAAYKKKLWDGYEISLGPVPDHDEVEYRCTGAIYNSAGRVVFRTSGFNVVFDEELTGQDFDGDGKPDVVFRTDTGGGNHCCWVTSFTRSRPSPTNCLRSRWKGKWISRKTKTGKL